MKLIEFVVPKQRSQTQEYEGEKIDFNINIIEPKKKAEISQKDSE